MRRGAHAGDHRPEHGRQEHLHAPGALIVLLAHIGSFVPADAARIGPIDRILTRIGAGDDLARGAIDLHGRDERDQLTSCINATAHSRWC
jgi:hypothetical protein